jgi:hypothetical protein
MFQVVKQNRLSGMSLEILTAVAGCANQEETRR